MKKLIISMGILLVTLTGFSQVTPTQIYRVADASTTFNVNISVGKQVYNVATNELWIATEGVASSETLTSAATSFTAVNGEGKTDLAEANATQTTVDVTSSTGTKATLESATAGRAGLMPATKFAEVELNNEKETNVPTDLSLGTVNETTVAINSDGGDDDVILAAANSTEAGLMTATDFSKLGSVETGAQKNYSLVTEDFEETGETAAAHHLGFIAETVACRVSLNGVVLAPSQYTLSTSTIQVKLPVAKYDKIVITYNTRQQP